MSLIRDGEVEARVAEWEAARVAERRLIAEQLAQLHPADLNTTTSPQLAGSGKSAEPETPCVSLGDSCGSESPQLLQRNHSYTDGMSGPSRPAHISLGSNSWSSTGRHTEQHRLDMLEQHMSRMRMGFANLTDENRFLRLEVDVLREVVLGRQDQEVAFAALNLIGRRAGTQEKRDSVCSQCLQRAACFRCYACRSVEYCSSQCQLKNFPAHLPLCRHVSERS